MIKWTIFKISFGQKKFKSIVTSFKILQFATGVSERSVCCCCCCCWCWCCCFDAAASDALVEVYRRKKFEAIEAAVEVAGSGVELTIVDPARLVRWPLTEVPGVGEVVVRLEFCNKEDLTYLIIFTLRLLNHYVLRQKWT